MDRVEVEVAVEVEVVGGQGGGGGGGGPLTQRDLGHLLPVLELRREVDRRARLEVGEGVDKVDRGRREPLKARQKAGQLSTRAGGRVRQLLRQSCCCCVRPGALPRPANQGPRHRVRDRTRQLWGGGACEQVSLTVTMIVISLASISSEHVAYLGSTDGGTLDRAQLRAMMTSGTKSPTWLSSRQNTRTNIDVTSILDERGLFSAALRSSCRDCDDFGLPPADFMIPPTVANIESRRSCDGNRRMPSSLSLCSCSVSALIARRRLPNTGNTDAKENRKLQGQKAPDTDKGGRMCTSARIRGERRGGR